MVAGAIGLPVERIPLEHHPLAHHVFAQPERSEPRDRLRRRPEPPQLRQPALGVRAVEQMPRQHREAVEQTLAHCVRLGEIDLHRVLVDLSYRHRLLADDQLVALRRSDLLILVHAKRKDHVVGVEWFAIGEADAAAER